jgi:hypothetical protein
MVPSCQSLSDNQHVRLNPFMHIGKKFSGAAEARLTFIEHQQHAILPANCFRFPQESLPGKDDAGLPLSGLEEKRAGISCDRLAESGRIPVGNHAELIAFRARLAQ